jgi:MraZ protein
MDVDIDAGSRVLISLELRTWAGLGEKLMMVGMGNRLEIWDHGRYQALEDATLAQPVPESLASLVF